MPVIPWVAAQHDSSRTLQQPGIGTLARRQHLYTTVGVSLPEILQQTARIATSDVTTGQLVQHTNLLPLRDHF